MTRLDRFLNATEMNEFDLLNTIKNPGFRTMCEYDANNKSSYSADLAAKRIKRTKTKKSKFNPPSTYMLYI